MESPREGNHGNHGKRTEQAGNEPKQDNRSPTAIRSFLTQTKRCFNNRADNGNSRLG